MNARTLLLSRLDRIAALLGDLVSELVFVGGTAVALYPLRPGTSVRPTLDVDCVVDADYLEYTELQQRLRKLGLRDPPHEGDPICRLRGGDLVLDVMPVEASVLGFSNRWYKRTIETAQWFELPSGRRVRAAGPAMLAATKLEAFYGRGRGDFLASHDLEDLLTLLSGDSTLLRAITQPSDLDRDESDAVAYLREELDRLMHDQAFDSAIAAHFSGDAAGQFRAQQLRSALRSLTNR
jgi:hypothetical protein